MWQQYLNSSDFKTAFLLIGFNSIIIALLQKEVCLIRTRAFSMRSGKMVCFKQTKQRQKSVAEVLEVLN